MTHDPFDAQERETAVTDVEGDHDVVPTSLIVSTRNRPGLVSAAVDSVLAGDELPSEIVVIDQSDRPHPGLSTGAVPSTTTLCYLWEPARGLSLGRNRGLAAARGEVLVFIDDDVIVPPDWFSRIVGALRAGGSRAVLTGRVVAGAAESPGAFAPSLSLSQEDAVYEGRPGRDVLLPMNMALFRSAVEQIGGFDERLGVGSHFPSSEDNDFGYRLLEAGYRIVHAPDVVVVHRAWRRPGALLPLRWAYGRGQGAYYAKYLSWRDRYMLRRMAWDVGRHLRRAPRRGRHALRDGAADVVYSVAVLVGAVEWLVAGRS